MSGNGKLAAGEAERLAQWDADIEADFQRTVASTKAASIAKRSTRLVGFPWPYLVSVRRSTTSMAALLLAVLIYRRTVVCKSRTVTLPGADLAELRIDRAQKSRALVELQRAGLMRIERTSAGRTSKVTLLW